MSRIVRCSRALLALVLLLPACGAQVDDGIFDPSAGGPAPGGPDDSAGTDGMDDGSESGDGDGGTDGTGGSASTSGVDGETEGADEAGSTGVADEGTCPEVAGPGGYQCPEGSTFSSGDGWARCTFEGLSLPSTPTLSAYCLYLDKGYLGFSWSLADVPVHECEPEARYAPTAETGYCLWEDIVLPSGAVQQECDGLAATGSLGFRWPCPPA